MLWTKRAHQCTIFQTFECLKEIYPIPHAIFETQRSGSIQILHHCSVSWKITPLYFLAQNSYTLDKNSPSKWNFWTFESFVYTLIDPFHAKYITLDLKKHIGVIFHDTEESCKIWRKTDLWFGKEHEKFGKFSSKHLTVSKLVLSWDPFVQSTKCTS